MMRFDFDGRVEEKGGQQFVSGRGVFGHGYTRVYRPEPHGSASSPVKGGKGILFPMPGNPDFAVVLGGEHPGLRPVLPAGGRAIYDANGNIISLVGTKVRYVAPLHEFVGNFTIDGSISMTGGISAGGSIVDGDGNNGA
ncbi:phage baseplate assembly protein [Rhizobium cremeum]|uniref:phage baseplate assembly protein domain-containing protein n=1 Tax=Rhizobium cremeum TaxID=2813827 RepID=UPI001FD416B4|nr:phage baseplate assembly protein [Rhizobium cremeum]MCJ7996697.1 phage baseplate assembly protein [Rhizobium cremeum]MCJ7999421.1 phage baseplate assembly protein [Rhizobium cremeum]